MTVPSGMKTPTVVHVSVCAISDCACWHEDTHCCACVSLMPSVTVPSAVMTLRYADCHAVYQLVLSVTVPLAVKTEVRRLSGSVSVGAVSDCTSCCEDTEVRCRAVYLLQQEVVYLLLWKF